MMKRWLAAAWIGLLLLPSVGCQPAAVSAQAPDEVDLHRQVQLLNLINGLELTSEQMDVILEKAEEAQGTQETLKDETGVAEVETILEKIRDALMAGENIPEELKDAFFAAKGDKRGLSEAYRKELTRLAEEVEEILEDHQLYALEHYVPCIFPPEGEPRIGQAREGKGAVLLERLRTVPDDRFERHKEKAARWVLRQVQRRFHGRILILDKEQELDRILELLERAWSLSDVAFELEKEELIEELLAPYQESRPGIDVTAVIARHLLDPAIIPLFEQKLALMAE